MTETAHSQVWATAEESAAAPDIVGHSKRIWLHSDGTCLVDLIPSLRSFTYDRDELIEETGKLRLDFYELAADRLAAAGVRTAFLKRTGPTAYLAHYRPAPPFEVIVKNLATGSTIRKYPGLFEEGRRFDPPVVKFDYRVDPEDQPIGEDYLRAIGVPVESFRQAALRVNRVLTAWLRPLDLWDFCLILAADRDGEPTVISEVSPDCMRLRSPDGRALDKDLFRAGADADTIIAQWRELIRHVRGKR
jgi:phosphoribosylaminoimidazole-succinocarboxamide synthase